MAVGEAVTVPGASCVREAESHCSAAMVGEARLRDLRAGAGFNNLSHAETRISIAFAGFAAQNLLREFTPDLLKATRRWHTPFPRIPLPEWWVKLPPR